MAGEAKRRRAAIAELKTYTREEMLAMGSICAWDGCVNTYERTQDGQPPQGWRVLYTFRRYSCGELPNGEPVIRVFAPEAGWERDAVLCPYHAHHLEEQLKPLTRELLAPAQGNA